MRNRFDKVYIGLLAGLIFPAIGFVVYYFINFDTIDMQEYIKHLVRLNKLAQVVSLSVIMNLAAFYLFLWKKYFYGARGVLAATFIWVLLVLIQKFA
jgi:hypothetical protein